MAPKSTAKSSLAKSDAKSSKSATKKKATRAVSVDADDDDGRAPTTTSSASAVTAIASPATAITSAPTSGKRFAPAALPAADVEDEDMPIGSIPNRLLQAERRQFDAEAPQRSTAGANQPRATIPGLLPDSRTVDLCAVAAIRMIPLPNGADSVTLHVPISGQLILMRDAAWVGQQIFSNVWMKPALTVLALAQATPESLGFRSRAELERAFVVNIVHSETTLDGTAKMLPSGLLSFRPTVSVTLAEITGYGLAVGEVQSVLDTYGVARVVLPGNTVVMARLSLTRFLGAGCAVVMSCEPGGLVIQCATSLDGRAPHVIKKNRSTIKSTVPGQWSLHAVPAATGTNSVVLRTLSFAPVPMDEADLR